MYFQYKTWLNYVITICCWSMPTLWLICTRASRTYWCFIGCCQPECAMSKYLMCQSCRHVNMFVASTIGDVQRQQFWICSVDRVFVCVRVFVSIRHAVYNIVIKMRACARLVSNAFHFHSSSSLSESLLHMTETNIVFETQSIAFVWALWFSSSLCGLHSFLFSMFRLGDANHSKRCEPFEEKRVCRLYGKQHR